MMSQIRSFYEGKYARDQLETDARLRRNRLTFCLPETLSGKRILDLGCGPGVQLAYLARENTLCGTDISVPALTQAGRNGYRVCVADLDRQSLPFKDETFDVVVCTDVLEHLFAPLFLVGEIHRVLRPEGTAVVSVPNQFDIVSRLRILFGMGLIHPSHTDFRAWDYFHIRYFTLSDWQDLLAETGFVIDEKFFSVFPIAILNVLSLLLKPEYVSEWCRRHRTRAVLKVLIWVFSFCMRATLVPALLIRILPKHLPQLFSAHFFVSCKKAGERHAAGRSV
jgi:methionine biosynthesis protein MetW